MDGKGYVLAVICVVLLGSAAGAFVNHRAGSSYAIPIVLALCGMVAGIAAWNWGRPEKRSGKHGG